MMKFTIAIEETIAGKFKVEANDVDEALEMAEKKYKNGEFVLCPGEVQFKQMSILHPENEASEWIEF